MESNQELAFHNKNIITMKKIAVFNHKGGVSKTTTVFNIGWKLARMGKRVLMVDADSQCNLTQYSLGIGAFEEFYLSSNPNNIKDALEPAFKSKPKLIEAVECIQIRKNENLYLLPGHLDLSENEVQLGMSFQLTDTMGALKNLPGSFDYLFNELTRKYCFDYIFIDMNPSLSAINQDLFISSDYFIVPTSPDIFSYMSIKSLAKFLPMWEKWAVKARPLFKDAEYPLPATTPKFLGYTINDFNLSNGNAALDFRKQMDRIAKAVEQELIPALGDNNMLLANDTYHASYELNKKVKSIYHDINPLCLAEISNFNKLIAISNERSIPIYEMKIDSLNSEGQRRTLVWFKALFDLIANKILVLTKA